MKKRPELRPARAEESRLLSELARRSKGHWGYSRAFMEACRAELSVSESDIADPDKHIVVAEQDRKAIGFYALERLMADEYELDALFVEPRFIGAGIGRALIEHAKTWASERGATTLLIQGDPHAERFYLAAGAVRVGERESDSIPGRYLPEYRITLGQGDAV